ncbi:MAG: SRPBCC family protein [Gemmatimonadetes bacterium]|nr:SRPBCC family protein [Gemmatimonadota bacterium]
MLENDRPDGASTAELDAEDAATRVEAAVRIRRPRDDVYQAWHDLQRLPHLIARIADTALRPDGDSRWSARGDAGARRWHVETVADDPGHRIAWRAVGDADVAHHGEVTFECVGNGRTTEVRLTLAGLPPGRLAGREAAECLEAFKRSLEAATAPLPG